MSKKTAEKRIYVIKAKMSGTGTIHDLASDTHNREINFGDDGQYAIVLAAYYGYNCYKVYDSEMDVIDDYSSYGGEYSYEIIDINGNEYMICDDELIRK